MDASFFADVLTERLHTSFFAIDEQVTETAFVDYHLSFANQGNKLPFPFPFAASKRKFGVSVCSKQT
jgi:hypothetical protein